MYEGVPTIEALSRVWMSRELPDPSDANSSAIPKSSTFTVPSVAIITLAGFRSRCTMPCSWAVSSASAI
jgi:hypothetical protein